MNNRADSLEDEVAGKKDSNDKSMTARWRISFETRRQTKKELAEHPDVNPDPQSLSRKRE
jgi:hypothetical protein